MPNKLSTYNAVGIAEGWIAVDTYDEVLEAWQFLVNTGLAWQLQGWFGRAAESMIESGEILSKEDYIEQYGTVL
jgi:hypothetical protein